MKKQYLTITPQKTENYKKFIRRPCQKSQCSVSKRSLNSSLKQIFIKSSNTTICQQTIKQKTQTKDFCNSFTETTKNKKKQENGFKFNDKLTNKKQNIQNKQMNDYEQTQTKKQTKVMQTQLQLKNHQINVLSGEVSRLKNNIEDEKSRRKKVENQKKQLSRELKQVIKSYDKTKIQLRKLVKQKEYLHKQIQFLQRINYDQKTRVVQSYRQKYLQMQLQKIRKQLKKTKGQRENQLDNQIKNLKEEKFAIQSHYKAMKVANQCLIKQITNTKVNIHDIILNSEEYKKLRDKYIRFLQEYKVLRNQYWLLKAEINNHQSNESDDLFNLTVSEVENDLSLLRSSNIQQGTITIAHSPQLNQSQQNHANQQPQTTLIEHKYKNKEPSYSFKTKFL